MYSFIILLAVSLTAVAGDDVDFEKCITVLKTQKHCCKLPSRNEKPIMSDDIKECKLMPDVPGSCDKALCFATKLGIATSNGNINMEKLEKHMKEKFPDDGNLLEAIKNECLDSGYKLYGEPDDCDLHKIGQCIHWQFAFRCPNFSDEEQCKEFKEIAPKCLELDS